MIARNYQSATLNQTLSCTAFELSVAQVLSLLFTSRDLTLPDDAEAFANIMGYRILTDPDFVRLDNPKQKLSEGDKKALIDFFHQVNALFFNPPVTRAEQIKQEKRAKLGIVVPVALRESYDNLLEECEIYTRWGHPGILEYPWSYFLTVRKHFNEWAEKVK